MPQEDPNKWGKTLCVKAHQSLFSSYNIEHTVTAPYHPESNGAVERVIGTVKNALKKVKLGGESAWKQALHISVASYQMSPHQATGYSPFKMLYGREAIWLEETPHLELDCDETYHEAVENHIVNMLEIHEIAMTKNRE